MVLKKKSKNSMFREDGESSVVYHKGDSISFALKDGNHVKGVLYEIREEGFAVMKEIFPGGPSCPCGLFCYDWIDSIKKETT